MPAPFPVLSGLCLSGGSNNRVMAQLMCHIGRSADFSAFPAFDALGWSGPLDAPEFVAAGSHNSVSARNARGDSLPAVSVVPRD